MRHAWIWLAAVGCTEHRELPDPGTQSIEVTLVSPADPGTIDRRLPETQRRVVVNLEHVVRLGGAAIGVLVAHDLRLDRLGGALRLCGANPRVATVLDQIRLPALLDIFPSLEDAVLATWDRGQGAA